ncbi:hypothetical protein E2C01_066050 [Portunus trituberculatus]|uniref:Uncharacterized protein n=1 Tax=Portunus trituberculatus TaxID=210409 RepID=A0A5B7HTH2_PORTR|nr:hypothetical protein [Portunus trituberculatus]
MSFLPLHISLFLNRSADDVTIAIQTLALRGDRTTVPPTLTAWATMVVVVVMVVVVGGRGGGGGGDGGCGWWVLRFQGDFYFHYECDGDRDLGRPRESSEPNTTEQH